MSFSNSVQFGPSTLRSSDMKLAIDILDSGYGKKVRYKSR